MERNADRFRYSIGTILFILLVLIGTVYSFKKAILFFTETIKAVISNEVAVSEAPTYFDNQFNSVFTNAEVTLDVFSLVQVALDKHEARNFEVLKSNYGMLYLQNNGWPDKHNELDTIAEEYAKIYEETVSYGGTFLYVQAPYKNAEKVKELKYYTSDKTEDSENYLVNEMQNRNIPVLDLRNYDECTGVYKTDHHWQVQSAFNASRIICEELKEKQGVCFQKNDYYGDVNNYEDVTYQDSFLGSIGIKVGPLFVGKDDFTVYRPKFNTDYTFKHLINHELDFRYDGDFWTVFIDQSLLDDKKYNNKYGALLHGAYVESIITNNNTTDEYKGLLISHSYGRPLSQYLSLNFSELRYLDPQEGRYNDDYLEYIQEYKPDVVILMYDSFINIGDGRWK